MATLITKNSQTASAVPSAGSLSTGELAVNTADAKVFTKHSDGSVKEITPSTVADGGITAAKLASNAVTTAKIADANVTGAKLENSGVTAGTYTSATVTVDAKGRVTAASSGSGGGVTSLNGQTGAITNTNLDSIGSYAVLMNTQNSNTGIGSTVAGSTLRYNGSTNFSNFAGSASYPFKNKFWYAFSSFSSYNGGGTSVSGTWRKMDDGMVYESHPSKSETVRNYGYALYVRIS